MVDVSLQATCAVHMLKHDRKGRDTEGCLSCPENNILCGTTAGAQLCSAHVLTTQGQHQEFQPCFTPDAECANKQTLGISDLQMCVLVVQLMGIYINGRSLLGVHLPGNQGSCSRAAVLANDPLK